MMRFDHRGLAQAGLDDVRVDGSLYQEVHRADLFRFLFKHADKFLADDFALSLRFCHAGQLRVETFLRVDTNKVQVIWTVRSEYRFHLIALVLAQKTMIDEDAGQLLTDGFGQKYRRDRGVHAA